VVRNSGAVPRKRLITRRNSLGPQPTKQQPKRVERGGKLRNQTLNAPKKIMKKARKKTSARTKTKTKKKTGAKPVVVERKGKMPEEKETKVSVQREGDKIIIPSGMSYENARKWITRQEQAEETLVNISDTIPCFPLDGMIAMQRAFDSVYGFTDVSSRQEWYGQAPPIMFQVTTPHGVETATYGRICPPSWEGGWLQANINGPQVMLIGQVKRKFEGRCKEIVTLTRKMLKERSIYRGEAFHVDLHWWDDPEGEHGGKPFNPINDAPKYMETHGADIILNETTEFQLSTSVYMIIERSELCKANGIPLKHGALFQGPFGTGKTLCAKVLAHKCSKHGWTFIYLKSADQLANGLRLAKMYAPALVFVEDVDTVVKQRNQQMNDLLNVLDGIDTKEAPIMVVLTTNNVEQIDPSFLRAGRIDTLVHFAPPDNKTAMKFVYHYGLELIRKDEDLREVGRALEGLVPAFICETVNKAKRYAIYREGKNDITGCITAEDLLKAAHAVREHLEMMEVRKPTDEQMIAHSLRTVHYFGNQGKVLAPLKVADRE
jgi:SpoVK/Ycf46/Vps4 family AAA+-type ATPase